MHTIIFLIFLVVYTQSIFFNITTTYNETITTNGLYYINYKLECDNIFDITTYITIDNIDKFVEILYNRTKVDLYFTNDIYKLNIKNNNINPILCISETYKFINVLSWVLVITSIMVIISILALVILICIVFILAMCLPGFRDRMTNMDKREVTIPYI